MTLFDHARVRVTPAQLRVLALLARGYTYEAIAQTLFIRPTTVRSHIEELQRRLGVPNNATLVLACVVVGILSSDTWPIALTGATDFDRDALA